MKRIVPYFILTMLCYSSIYGQSLTLTDLTTLCSKKKWEDVNKTLLTKKWAYYDSKKGDSYKYSKITWSFNKDYYTDEAPGWFHLYTYEGYPNKISYYVFNRKSSSIIQNSISSAGFKLINSEIEDNKIISTYSNANYTLEITTEKREGSDYSWEGSSHTAYIFTLIKKAGIYDPANGKKTTYFYNNVVETEYTLLNGELHGPAKAYYSDGKLRVSSNFLRGKEHGNFVEYDEDGNKVREYVMANGMRNGVWKVYKEGRIDYSATFKDDIRNGQYVEYYYNEETDKLQLKTVGEYLNDKKSGVWKLFFIENNNTQRILMFDTYAKGIKNGAFQKVMGDSLMIGYYKDDKLHGRCKIYFDANRELVGGMIRTDTANLTLIAKGSYFEDEKSGYWKNYDLAGTLESEGGFSNGQETGEWKYYYISWVDDKGVSLPYSKQLYLVANYKNGKLDGKTTRYSYLNEEKYPCSEVSGNKSTSNTCVRYIYQKVLETSFYKNGKLNGLYEIRDSLNEVYGKGIFKDDLKEGEWLQRYIHEDLEGESHFIYQKGSYRKDKREGKWIQHTRDGKITATFNYDYGDLNGEYIVWNQFNKPAEKKQFSYGDLTELIIYDSVGVNPIIKYEIYNVKSNSYTCRETQYFKDGYESQEYWLQKDGKIEHELFEFIFELSINDLSDGTAGYKDGEFKLFNSNSQPIVTGKFYKKDSTGLWTFYYYDQKVKIESDLSHKPTAEKYLTLNGELFSGEFDYINNETGINEVRKVKNGLRNGKTVYTDAKTKKKIKTEKYKNGELK